VPSGWLADRFGARVTLTRIVVWWSVMTAATGLAGGFLSLVADSVSSSAPARPVPFRDGAGLCALAARAERGRMFGARS